MKKKLVIGIIQTSFGVNGEVRVKSLSGETDHFKRLKIIYLENKGMSCQFRVEKIRIKADKIYLKLEGIDTPEQGKALCLSEIWVNREEACELDDDEFYYGDLFECEVIKEALIIGKVRNIFEAGNTIMLEVEDNNGKAVMIPFIDSYIENIDINNNKIILRNEAQIE